MRHARQLQAQRRGGDIAGPAWPSIVATTTSLTGAAAGIASLVVWNDTLHLRLGVGMAAAGAVFSSLAVLAVRRDRTTRRELMAAVREDHAAELKFEIERRDKAIAELRSEARVAEQTIVLFEARVGEEQARADSSEAARVRAEHDLAVLSAWVHQTTAAAELTRSAVQSFAAVQPFEPAHRFDPVPVHDTYNGVSVYDAVPGYQPAPVYDAVPVYQASPGYDVPAGSASRLQPAVTVYDDVPVYDSVQAFEADYGAADIDLRPAASVPLAPSPILAAAQERPANGSRPLRSTVLSVRDEVGFDVRGAIATPGADPYLVPGVAMPRQQGFELPKRPVSPERLYRPYLGSEGPVDLTMYDETQQMYKVDDRKTGTA